MEMHPHRLILCVQENIAERPSMASVVLMLNSFSRNLPVLSQPAFVRHSSVKSNTSSSQQEFHLVSTNEASITELYPRQCLMKSTMSHFLCYSLIVCQGAVEFEEMDHDEQWLGFQSQGISGTIFISETWFRIWA